MHQCLIRPSNASISNIIGTLGDSLDAGEDAFSYSDIPHFPISTAPSHKSRLLFGKLSGVSVVLMQGRFHLYEGYSIQKVSIYIKNRRSASYCIS